MWAFEHEGIVPDIVASAKGLGGGLPLGAMIARSELARKWQPGSHGNTYGGNGLTCAVAYELLTMVEEELMDNAATVGAYLLEQLQALQQRFPQIGAVRGRGLMIGVEFVDSQGNPAGALAEAVMVESFRKGLLVLTCGASTIRFCPPLTLTKAQADEAVARFALAIEACLTA
jgi:4-aminobutyrate aminotransferase